MSNWIKDVIRDTEEEIDEKQNERKEEVDAIREHQKRLSDFILPVLRNVGNELYGHTKFLRKPKYVTRVTWTAYYCRWELISKEKPCYTLQLFCPGLQKLVSASLYASHYKRKKMEDYNWAQVEGMQIASRTINSKEDVRSLLKEPIKEVLRSKAFYE